MIVNRVIFSTISVSLVAISLLELPSIAIAEIPTVTHTFLTGVNESTGTANFGLFFRICVNFFGIGKSCTPYFIGPVPWIPVKENDLVILGKG